MSRLLSGLDQNSHDNPSPGQCPARQAAHKAGIPFATPSYNVNMVCGSGLMSIISATQHIQCNPQGEQDFFQSALP